MEIRLCPAAERTPFFSYESTVVPRVGEHVSLDVDGVEHLHEVTMVVHHPPTTAVSVHVVTRLVGGQAPPTLRPPAPPVTPPRPPRPPEPSRSAGGAAVAIEGESDGEGSGGADGGRRWTDEESLAETRRALVARRETRVLDELRRLLASDDPRLARAELDPAFAVELLPVARLEAAERTADEATRAHAERARDAGRSAAAERARVAEHHRA